MVAAQQQIGHRVQALCRKRNSISPFSKLPPELAGQILASALHDASDIMNRENKSVLPRAIVHHILEAGQLKEWGSVSSGWLKLVRRCPDLWTLIGLSPERDVDMLKIQLQRSGTLPLSIAGWQPGGMRKPLEMVLEHAGRFRHAAIVLGENDRKARVQLLARLMSVPMPYLEFLDLTFWYQERYGEPDGGSESPSDDSNGEEEVDEERVGSEPTQPNAPRYDALKLGGGPRFIKLFLRNTLIHPDSPGLANLKDLRLTVPLKHGHLDLLPILASTPRLESLEVSDSRDRRSIVESLPKWSDAEGNALELQHLRLLILGTMSILASYLHTPSIRSLRLDNRGPTGTSPNKDLLKPDRAILDYLHSVRPDSLDLHLWGAESFWLSSPEVVNDWYLVRRELEGSPLLSLKLPLQGLDTDDSIEGKAFRIFVRALPDISLKISSFPHDQMAIFKGFPVVSISLEMDQAKRWSFMIAKIGGEVDWLWPKLREISLEGIEEQHNPGGGETWVGYLGLGRRVEAAQAGLVSHWTLSIMSSKYTGRPQIATQVFSTQANGDGVVPQ